jgi:uncharacterized membrane protein
MFIAVSRTGGVAERSNAAGFRGGVAMTYVLWLAQILLALTFLAAGVLHAFRYEQAQRLLPWVSAVPREQLRLIGLLEFLGAVGVILPAVTGVFPWLTPLAAVGLGLIMLSAIVFHLSRRERSNALGLSVVLAVAIFVAVGRYVIVPL